MTTTTAIISAHDLYKTYRLGRVDVPVLKGVSLDVAPGEFVAILGASGSGKSTLLHLLGGLDRPDKRKNLKCPKCGYSLSGLKAAKCPECATFVAQAATPSEVLFEGRSLASMSSGELDDFRSRSVGFIFQMYHLFAELSVLENVLIGAMVRHGLGFLGKRGEQRKRTTKLLERVGLGHRLKHRPVELSGGERQRVAIARALVNSPKVLLADEPTGNLDRTTGNSILDMLGEFHQRDGQTLVVVTHDPETARRADRVVKIEDGRLVKSAALAAEYRPPLGTAAAPAIGNAPR